MPRRLTGHFCLLLRFFVDYSLAQCRIKLRKFYFTFNLLLIFARPNNMLGLRGFEPEQAVL